MKKHRTLEDADEEEVAPCVVRRDLRTELADPRLDRVALDEDLAAQPRAPSRAPRVSCVIAPHLSMRGRCLPSQVRRRLPERRRRRHPTRRAASSRAQRAAPSRRRTGPCTFLLLPARRSPGRRVRTTSPGRELSILHGPKRTRPSRRTSSYSRTARTPPPRSADFVPSVDARSSASVRSSSRGRRGRSSASARRFRSAAGWSRCRSGRISSRMRPRFVDAFDESTR